MECSRLQRLMQGYGDGVDGRTIVPQSDVASFLADHTITELLQRTNDTFCWNSPWELHAASTGISSSFT